MQWIRSSIQNPSTVTLNLHNDILVRFFAECLITISLVLKSCCLLMLVSCLLYVRQHCSPRYVTRFTSDHPCHMSCPILTALAKEYPNCNLIYRNVHLYTPRRGVWDIELQMERNIHQLQQLQTSKHPCLWTQPIDSDKDERFPHLWRTSEMD